MLQVGIKEAKNNLSQLLARVEAGEEVLITKRGRPVARIVREPDAAIASIRAALAQLVEEGLATLPTRSLKKDVLPLVKVKGKPVSEMVIEDRR